MRYPQALVKPFELLLPSTTYRIQPSTDDMLELVHNEERDQ